jgi:hypothetical protein
VNCLHCGAPTTNGLALCDLCQRKAATDLEFLPVYFRNLARWRPPARPNGGMSGAGQWMLRRGEQDGNHIANALDRAGNDAATWAQCLADDRGLELPVCDDEPATFEATCALLGLHLTSIGTLEWAGEFVRAIDRHERTMRSLTETMVPGWYAGSCKRRVAMETEDDNGLCGAPTYVVPGLTWVTCRACGSTTYARDHLDTILAEARGWVARPMRLAEAAVALIDTELSVSRLHKRISKWGERTEGKCITAVRRLDADGDPVGPKSFRFGEVLDALFSEGATRLDDVEDVQAC